MCGGEDVMGIFAFLTSIITQAKISGSGKEYFRVSNI